VRISASSPGKSNPNETETSDDAEDRASGGENWAGARVAEKLSESDEKNGQANADDGQGRSKKDHGESISSPGRSARGAEVAEKVGEEGITASAGIDEGASGIQEHGDGSHQEEQNAGGRGEAENVAVKKICWRVSSDFSPSAQRAPNVPSRAAPS